MVQSVEVPGDIMKTTIILGLTLKELGLLFGSPLMLVLPAMYIKQIPFSFAIGFVIITMPIILLLIIQTPDGQSPISWIGAMVTRRITPDVYHLQPSEGRRADAKHLNVVHTADRLKEESRGDSNTPGVGAQTNSDSQNETGQNQEVSAETDRR